VQKTGGPILTIYVYVYVTWCVFVQGVAFWG